MIEQVGLKTVLMLDTEFCNAYYQLKEMLLNSDDFWFIDSLKIFIDLDSSFLNYYSEYKIKYKDFWIMLAEEKEKKEFGVVVVEIEE